MSDHEHGADLQRLAKEHGMSVEEFAQKSGVRFNEDGSHSLEGHTVEMMKKEYTEAELKDLAVQHGMSVDDIQKHIQFMKQHHD